MSDNRDLAHYDENQAPANSGGVIRDLLLAAKDPAIDAAKIETLTNLAVRLQDRELAAEFNRDKIAAIREMPAIYKRGQSDKHRYAKFEDLHRAVMPILGRHNMTLDFRVGSDGTAITVQPILRHVNGHVEEGGTMKAGPDQGPGRSPVQAVGSTTSYLKRHSLKAMLNIIEDQEDNDGVGFREDEQKNDRQERLILDAEAHAVAGDYDDWFKTQPTKDRSWLILAGVHARCGGAPALPPPAGSSPVGRPEVEPEDAVVEPVDEPAATVDERPVAKPEPEPEAEPDSKTPEGWTTIFERNCAAAGTLGRVDDLAKAGANAIRKLSNDHPKLYERADRAMLDARDRIAAQPADEDVFPGDR